MNLHFDMSKPLPDEIFVFGSNLAGVHGAGAALAALHLYGAEMGKGQGYAGRSYALPTKDHNIRSLNLMQVNEAVCDFVLYVKNHPNEKFFITRVGCGLAGNADEDIAPMFHEIAENDNCSFPMEWEQYLRG